MGILGTRLTTHKQKPNPCAAGRSEWLSLYKKETCQCDTESRIDCWLHWLHTCSQLLPRIHAVYLPLLYTYSLGRVSVLSLTLSTGLQR